MNIPFLIWCAVFLGAILFELMSPGLFYFLSFACGALAAAGVSFFEVDLATQLTWFIVITVLALLLLRRFVNVSHNTGYSSNVDALKGKQGFVLQDITQFAKGAVKINGQIWSAQSHDGSLILQGSLCEVVSVSGAYVIVKKVF